MKNLLLSFTFVILILNFPIYSQNKSEARLIDEFGKLACGDTMSRFDAFIIELNNNPDALGYVYIHGDLNDPIESLFYEFIILGEIKFHELGEVRIKIIRAKAESNLRTQFWLVPDGVEPPNIQKENYIEKIAFTSKPIIAFYDGDGGYCSLAGQENIFIELLNANQNNRGHIVIHAKSRRNFEKKKRELAKLYETIQNKRIRYFYINGKIPLIEYWLVPTKK